MNECELDFQKIYADYRTCILRYLTRLVGEYDAEDLTQEVFVRISKAFPAFRGEAQLKTWIYRIATNAAIDLLRKPENRRLALVASLDNSNAEEIHAGSGDDWFDNPTPTLEDKIFTLEKYRCYQDFVGRLPESYRAVVVLNQIGEYTANEIADLLGLNISVVKIRLHRGKARLLQELKAHCKPEDWL